MIFSYLDKSKKDQWLPRLFDLLYDNMRLIAPSVLPYEREKSEWLEEVSSALEKTSRQIILCFVEGELAGYMQYYIREHMLMIEEIQLKKEFHRTFLFYRFCKYVLSILPSDLQTIEAYADKRNSYSQRIMRSLGMHFVEQNDESPFVHLFGQVDYVKKFFK